MQLSMKKQDLKSDTQHAETQEALARLESMLSGGRPATAAALVDQVRPLVRVACRSLSCAAVRWVESDVLLLVRV